MKISLRKLFLSLAGIVGLTLIIFYSVDSKTYGTMLCSKLSQGSTLYAKIHFESCRSRLYWIEAENISAVPRKLPFGLKISKIDAMVTPWSLLGLTPELRSNFSLYDGTIVSSFKYSPFSTSFFEAVGANIALPAHPALRALGATAGTISFPSLKLRLDKETLKPIEGEWTLRLDGLTVENSPYLFGMKIVDGTVHGSFILANDTITSKDLFIRSSYGSISPLSEITITNLSSTPLIHGEISITLSIEGERTFGALLKAYLGAPPDSPTSSFKLQLKGPLSRPLVTP